MKKIIVIFIFIITGNLFAQNGTAAIKLGHFSPAAADGGFIVGFEGGKYIENGISIAWSIDWFHKSYVDRKLVSEFNDIYGVDAELNELRAKTNLHDFPLMGHISYQYPVAPKTNIFINGGIGAEFLIIHFRNFQNPDEGEFQLAVDLNWEIGIGAIYQIGRMTEVFAEFTFHSAEPSWEYNVYDPAINKDRIFERVFDMSGIMARVGFRYYY